MLETFSESIFRYWENSHYQYRQGLYEGFSRHLDTIVALVRNDAALISWWRGHQSSYSAAFTRTLNEQLDPGACQPGD